jgi:hypothetical protein
MAAPITIDPATLGDFLTMVKQAHGEFQAECGTKARKYRLYFVKRDSLRNILSSIRNTVPAGTKARPVPSGVSEGDWKKLIDLLEAAEKLLREEAKKVKPDAPMPPPVRAPKTSGPTMTKRVYRRREARKKLKNLLKDIYGKDKGKLRYKLIEKLAKEAGREGSPQSMWSLFNGDTVEGQKAVKAEAKARRAGTSSDSDTDDASIIAPTDAATAGAIAGQQPAGLMATLWPTDKPIYARPAAIGGALLVVGVVGWMLLSTPAKPAPRPAAKPAEKKTETKAL